VRDPLRLQRDHPGKHAWGASGGERGEREREAEAGEAFAPIQLPDGEPF